MKPIAIVIILVAVFLLVCNSRKSYKSLKETYPNTVEVVPDCRDCNVYIAKDSLGRVIKIDRKLFGRTSVEILIP